MKQNSRPPDAHYISFNKDWGFGGDDELEPEELGKVVKDLIKRSDLQNYDIVVNKDEEGYRNQGVYIYKDDEVHPLALYPDDYGNLPEWVKIRKEDCGHSYFSDGLIDHNEYVPFQTNDWKVGKCYVDDKEIKPFKFPFKSIKVKIELHRPKDGAKASVPCDVMISAPWLGGPTEDALLKTHKEHNNLVSNDLIYENGNKLRIEYTYKSSKDVVGNPVPWSYGEFILLEPLKSQSKEVNIPKNIIKKATERVKEKMKLLLESRKTVYFESIGPCNLDFIRLPTMWNGKIRYDIYTVIPLESGRKSGRKSTRKSTRKSARKSTRKSARKSPRNGQ